MKTPMQEMLEWVRATLPMDLDWPMLIEDKVQSLIQKEKEVMCGIYDDSVSQFDPTYIGQEKYGEHYYNETFNTKEK